MDKCGVGMYFDETECVLAYPDALCSAQQVLNGELEEDEEGGQFCDAGCEDIRVPSTIGVCKHCLDDYDGGTFYLNGKCAERCSETGISFYVIEDTHKICVRNCEIPYLKRYYESDSLVQCYNTCPPFAPVDNDNVCSESGCAANEFYDMTSKSCMTQFQCNINDGYVYSRNGYKHCLTADECARTGGKAFAKLGTCVATGVDADDFDVRENVYECKSGTYLDHVTLAGSANARCVSSDECMARQYYLYEPTGLCTPGVVCQKSNLYFYESIGEGATRRYCVVACPAGTFLQANGRSCVGSCAESKF